MKRVKVKAVFLDRQSLDQGDLDFSCWQDVFEEVVYFDATDVTQVNARIADADVVISNKVMLNAATLQQAPKLKLILVSATGTNNVDLQRATAQQIVVCNCQAYGTAAVAQHTLMLMLNLATSFLSYQQAVQQGQWQQAQQFCLLNYPIAELNGRTLGILGYGELGQAVARLADAFGMQVQVGQLPGRPLQSGRVNLDTLLATSDFISLHCPLTDLTRDLIDAAAFAKMKPSAFLINCARGGIVNEQALADALRDQRIAGAATDVLSVEPPQRGNILLDPTLPNLIITPHSAWGSVEARQRIVQQVMENARAFIQGQPIRQVNATPSS